MKSTKREKIKNQLELLRSIEVSAKHDLKEAVKLLQNTRKVIRQLEAKLKNLEGKNVQGNPR